MSTVSPGLLAEKYDFDFWYNPSYKNYFSLLNALEELGQDVSEFKKEKAPDPHRSFFRFDLEKASIDFLPIIVGLSKFILSYEKKEIVNIDGIEIYFISLKDLIISKEANARQKDIDDIDQLRSRNDKSEDSK